LTLRHPTNHRDGAIDVKNEPRQSGSAGLLTSTMLRKRTIVGQL
jgi:hypothetical protein